MTLEQVWFFFSNDKASASASHPIERAFYNQHARRSLVAVRQAAHAAHDAKHIVVARENLDGVIGGDTLKVEGGVIDAAHVTASRRLMLFGAKGERVHADRVVGDTLVVLVRLDELVVLGLSGRGPVVAVELEVSLIVTGIVVTNTGTRTLRHPDKLLYRVVEVELDFALHALLTCELQLFDEVLVCDLGKSASLVRVEVDVVHVKGGGVERREGGIGGGAGVEACELDDQLDLVVLQCDQRQRQARVAAEPELKRDEERARSSGVGGASVRDTVDHLAVTSPVAFSLRKLVPDMQPFTVVFINALPANLTFDGGNELVAEVIDVSSGRKVGKVHLDVDTVDEITVSGHGARNFLTVIRGTIELLINGLHTEVRVPSVYHFPESYLGVSRQVDVLRAVGYQLHQAASHFVCFIYSEKKI